MVSETDFGFELVVEHKILSDSDAAKVLKMLNITSNKLPKILVNDPQIALENAKAGQIVAIYRNGPSGKHTHYRVVVEEV